MEVSTTSDRTLRVRLQADIASYVAGLKQASTATAEFGRNISGLGDAKSADIEKLGNAALVMGGAVGLAFAGAVTSAASFDRQLSELAAVSGAAGEELQSLRQAALDAGAATAFSASEAAQAQTELAKAGVGTTDILAGGLTGALDLAAAGGLELADAATYAANAMTTFGLSGRDVGKIADVLAAGANKSAADVRDIGQALQQSGLVADQFGLSLEDSVGVLAAFAQAGLRGSDAGTSFKTMLQRLVPQSAEAADLMDELGIQMFDATGGFVGIEQAAQELQEGLAGLTEEQRNTALATLFGSDAVRAATVLYENGADGIAEWVAQVDHAGFAADVAAQRLDNLSGDIEALRGSIETALIESGSKATDVLRFLTQAATDTVNGFGEMPSLLQYATLGLGGLAGTGGLALGVVAKLGPHIKELHDALMGMGNAGQFVGRNMGRLAAGVGVATAAIGVISFVLGRQAEKQAAAEAVVDSYTQAILDQNGALQENIDLVTARELGSGSFATALRENLADFDLLNEGVRRNREELELLSSQFSVGQLGGEFARELEEAGLASSALGDELLRLYEAMGGRSSSTFDDFLAKMADLAGQQAQGAEEAANQAAATEGLGNAAAGAAGPVGGLESTLGDTTDAASDTAGAFEDAEAALRDYIDAARGIADPFFALESAARRQSRSQVDAQRAAEDLARAEEDLAAARRDPNASARDIQDAERRLADAQRNVTDAQVDAAQAAADLETAQMELAGEVELGTTSVDEMNQALVRWVDQGTITAEQAFILAGSLGELARVAEDLNRDVTLRIGAEIATDPQSLAAIDTISMLLSGGAPSSGGSSSKAMIPVRGAFASGGLFDWPRGEPGLVVGHGGEGVVTAEGMDRIGAAGLRAINDGGPLGGLTDARYLTPASSFSDSGIISGLQEVVAAIAGNGDGRQWRQLERIFGAIEANTRPRSGSGRRVYMSAFD